MKKGILICGLGPGNSEQITEETIELLFGHRPVFLRTAVHPSVHVLEEKGLKFSAFDALYQSESSFERVYEKIVKALLFAAEKEEILYAVPGHPLCGEATVQGLLKICKEKDIPYHVYPAISFIDVCLTAIERDPFEGLTILDALTLHRDLPAINHGILITQVYNSHIAGEVKLLLSERYDDEMQVALIYADAEKGKENVEWLPLYQIDREDRCNHLTTLYIPEQKKNFRDISALTGIMSKLRAPEGCPWDRAQTHESLRKYLLEETYEALDAIDRGDIENLIEELGDLLYQIVFHSEIGREKGYFDFNDVVEGICEKMIRRHPHVFGHRHIESETELNQMWDQIKKSEKKDKGITETGSNIPKAFPALVRAEKLIKKAKKAGIENENIEACILDLQNGLIEMKAPVGEDVAEKMIQAVGNLLLAMSRLAVNLNIDAELALKDGLFIYEKQLCEKLSELG